MYSQAQITGMFYDRVYNAHHSATYKARKNNFINLLSSTSNWAPWPILCLGEYLELALCFCMTESGSRHWLRVNYCRRYAIQHKVLRCFYIFCRQIMSVNVNQHTTIKTVQRRLISVHYAVAVQMNSVVTHAVPSATHLNVVYITLVIR